MPFFIHFPQRKQSYLPNLQFVATLLFYKYKINIKFWYILVYAVINQCG